MKAKGLVWPGTRTLEEAGISFIGPVHRYGKDSAWSHFVGPDGNVYEITRDGSRT